MFSPRLRQITCATGFVLLACSYLAGSSLAQGQLFAIDDLPGANEEYGTSVAMIPDVDGDGISDVVIGDARHLSTNRGLVAVHSGATGAEIYSIIGSANHQRLGSVVVGVTDLDGDGVPDIAAGATIATSPSGLVDAGKVLVLSGATGATILEIYGLAQGDQIGKDIASVVDVDGDGLDDLLVGSFFGLATVYSSATGAALRTTTTSGVIQERYGWCVARLSDLDGDGVDEYAVGAPSEASLVGGYVDIHSGATGTVLRRIHGDSDNDRFGAGIADVGDLDGDGVGDLAIGAPRADHPPNDSGCVWIHSGASGALIDRVDGLGVGQNLGARVAVVGDINGDGINEIAAAAHRGGLYGTANGIVLVFDGATRAMRFVLTNPSTNSDYGAGLAAGRDLDGDGIGDIVVGGPNSGSSGTGGAVFAYTSAPDGRPTPYCVGKVNSLGCTAVTSTTGTASIQGGDNLTVHADLVLPGSPGFYFWGLAPDSRLTVYGTICVNAGVARTPVFIASTAGPGPCDGRMSFLFDTSYLQWFGVQPGTRIHVQGWYRDAFHPDGSGASLTPGLAFTVCP